MDKIQKIYETLLRDYGSQRWWPIRGKYSGGPKTKAEQFEVCVGAILAQSTSWKNVEKALEHLKNAKALNNKALQKMPLSKLAKLIKPAGYYNQKAKKIKEFLKFLKTGKQLTRENLLSVWGIGPETADSMLLYAHNKPHFVIDAYTRRILSRLGVCKNADKCSYDDLQQMFHKKLPRNAKLFNEFHALLVEHAKRSCRKKPGCGECAGCIVRTMCKRESSKK